MIDELRKPKNDSESSADMVARVKWTFKSSQVQLLRTTLDSCKVTLHLMLATLEFAQRIASRRQVTPNTKIHSYEQESKSVDYWHRIRRSIRKLSGSEPDHGTAVHHGYSRTA